MSAYSDAISPTFDEKFRKKFFSTIESNSIMM